MPKSSKRNTYFAAPYYSTDQQADSISARRRRRMIELETELAALKAAEMSNADTTPSTSPTPFGSPPPSNSPQEELFARLPQSRAKTILGLALKLPTEKT